MCAILYKLLLCQNETPTDTLQSYRQIPMAHMGLRKHANLMAIPTIYLKENKSSRRGAE